MKKLRITVGNKTYDVTVEVLSDDSPAPSPVSAAQTPPVSLPAAESSAAAAPVSLRAGEIGSPMAGTVKTVLVKQGDSVAVGDSLVILEAMKMENQITATAPGTVKQINVQEGASVHEGEVLLVVG